MPEDRILRTLLKWTPAQGKRSRRPEEEGLDIRHINNIDFLSEVSTIHQFVYTDEAFLLVRQ